MSVNQFFSQDATEKQDEQAPNWFQLFEEGEYGGPRARRGDIFESTILSIGEHDIIVAVDGKRDGIVEERDLENVPESYLKTLKVGDKIPVRVVKVPFNRSSIVVSLKQGLEHQDWLKAEEMMENHETFEVEIIDANRGGVLAPFGRLQGFIPNSHLTRVPRGANNDQRDQLKNDLMGETITVMVIEVNPRRRRLILSERVAAGRRRQEILQELHEGAIRTGVVSNIVDFGAFIDLGGVDGLLHISEISWDHVNHPKDVLGVGEEIEVYVLDVDRERERIALSRKRLLPDPWETVTATLHRGDEVEGTITHVTDFGAFVDVGNGVEGLVHVSEMPDGEATLGTLVPSSTVKVKILYIDALQQRISLHLGDSVEVDVEAEAETETEVEAEAQVETDVEADPTLDTAEATEPDEADAE
jgi:small subunit ribosomal protein S1